MGTIFNLKEPDPSPKVPKMFNFAIYGDPNRRCNFRMIDDPCDIDYRKWKGDHVMSAHVSVDVTSQLAADIVIAYLEQQAVELEKLPGLVIAIRTALTADLGTTRPRGVTLGPAADREPEALSAPSPKVVHRSSSLTPESSITPDFLISFEDGKSYRSLKRHLRARYNMSPDEYRTKWGLPADYPMVAPSYAADRSAVAKRIGLGQRDAAVSVEEARTQAPPPRSNARSRSTLQKRKKG
jgi:predicted transcriptional regulator